MPLERTWPLTCTKVALYTKVSTMYEPTSQYGHQIFCEIAYQSNFLYIIIAQWSKALVL